MRLLILFISFLISQVADSQIISASPPYRVRATASCSYLLDQYSGATAAYSLMKVRSAYSGAAIRVRESGGNTEQDIGFVGCYLDTATLKTFCGANSGYVVTWYDQANSNDAVQSTAGNQPRIVNAGAVERVDGKVAVRFIASSNTGLVATVSVSESASSTFAAWYYTSSNDGGARVFSNRVSGLSDYQTYVNILQNGSTTTLTSSYIQATGYQAAVTTAQNTLYLYNNFNTGTEIKNSIDNGTESTYTYSVGSVAAVRFTLGVTAWSDDTVTDGNLDGYIVEVIHFASDKSSDRSGINSQINTRYSIY